MNLMRRCAGYGIGVEYRGDGLDSVDQAGAWADHDAVSVDRPYRNAGQVPGYYARLIDGAGQVVTAGCDDDVIGIGSRDRRPRRRDRCCARPRRDWLTARGTDKIGDPVPGVEWRIHPFHNSYPGQAPPGHARRDLSEPGLQLADQPGGAVRHSGTVSNRLNRVKDLSERVRIQGQHLCPAAEVVQRILNLR